MPAAKHTPWDEKRRFRTIALVLGSIVLGLAALFGWRQWDSRRLQQASADFRNGEFRAAFRKASRYLSSRPGSQAAALLAARSLARLGRVEEAEAYYQKAGRLSEDSLQERAFMLAGSRLNENAIEVYREILERSPGDIKALRGMAFAQIMLGHWSGALETTSRLKETRGGLVISHTLAGVVYHDSNRPDEAISEFLQVLVLDPDLGQIPLQPKSLFWNDLCQDLLSLGKTSEARLHLVRALREGDEPTLLDLLGESYWQDGEIEEAESAWLASIRIDAQRPRPWLLLGILELQRNCPGRAIVRLERAASLAPTAREPAYGLSQAYQRLGRHKEAARYRASAKRLGPEILRPPPGMGAAKSPRA